MVMTLFFVIIGLLNLTVVWGKVFAYIGLAIAGFLTLFLLWLAFVRFLERKIEERQNTTPSNEQKALERRIAILEGKFENLDVKISELRHDVAEIGKMVGKDIIYIG